MRDDRCPARGESRRAKLAVPGKRGHADQIYAGKYLSPCAIVEALLDGAVAPSRIENSGTIHKAKVGGGKAVNGFEIHGFQNASPLLPMEGGCTDSTGASVKVYVASRCVNLHS